MSVREEVVGHRVSPGAPVAVAVAVARGGDGGCRSYRCTRQSCGWPGSRSRRRGPCAGRRGRARCTVRPAAWRTRGSSRSCPVYQADAGGAARRRAGSALAPAAAVLAGDGLRREAAVSRTHAPRRRRGPSRSPARPRPPRGVSGAYPAVEGEQEHEGAADGAQASGGHGRGAMGGGRRRGGRGAAGRAGGSGSGRRRGRDAPGCCLGSCRPGRLPSS